MDSHEIVFVVQLLESGEVFLLNWLEKVGEFVLELVSFQPKTILNFLAVILLVLTVWSLDLPGLLFNLSHGRLHLRSVNVRIHDLFDFQSVDSALQIFD